MENFPACVILNHTKHSGICLSAPAEHISLWIAAIVLIANSIHMAFLVQLKQHKEYVFYITLRLTAIVDIITSIASAFLAICALRQRVILLHQATFLISTLLGVTIFGVKHFVVLFTVVERWLLLAKPFQYKLNIFIRRYTVWVWLSVFFSFVVALLTYPLMYLYDSQACYDAGFGILGTTSDLIYLMVLPYFMMNFSIMISAILFFIEYFKLRRQKMITADDIQLRHSCFYVAISTLYYTLCALVSFIFQCMYLSRRGDELKPWMLTVNQSHGLWNILALYIALKCYRDKVINILRRFSKACTRRISSGHVSPVIIAVKQ